MAQIGLMWLQSPHMEVDWLMEMALGDSHIKVRQQRTTLILQTMVHLGRIWEKPLMLVGVMVMVFGPMGRETSFLTEHSSSEVNM